MQTTELGEATYNAFYEVHMALTSNHTYDTWKRRQFSYTVELGRNTGNKVLTTRSPFYLLVPYHNFHPCLSICLFVRVISQKECDLKNIQRCQRLSHAGISPYPCPIIVGFSTAVNSTAYKQGIFGMATKVT